MQVNDQFNQARNLIHQKRYTEARNILQSIQHPSAQEWLTKLDNLVRSESIKPSSTPSNMTFNYVIAGFVQDGWRVISQSNQAASLEKKATSNILALLLFIPSLILFLFFDFFIGAICLGVALLLVVINNMTKKHKTAYIALLNGGEVQVTSNESSLNKVYVYGYNGQIKS